MSTKDRALRIIDRKATKYRVPAWLLKAQIQQESGFQQGVGSPAGARDIAQFMPATAATYGVTLGDGKIKDDLDGQARMMRDLLKQFGGDPRKALAGYNAGAGAVQKYGGIPPYAETQNYVKTIMGQKGRWDTGSSPTPTAPPRQGTPGALKATGQTTITATDPELVRKQAFAKWFAARNPTSPLVKFGVLDPNMSTLGTTSIPKLKYTPGSPADVRQSAPSGGGSAAAVAWAQSKVGKRETGGQNRGRLPDRLNAKFGFGRSGGQPWCAMFTSVAVTAGGAPSVARTASVREVRRQATEGGGGYQKGFIAARRAKPGDLILWGERHIGMVERVTKEGIQMIAGNDSQKVNRRNVGFQGFDVVRPRYRNKR